MRLGTRAVRGTAGVLAGTALAACGAGAAGAGSAPGSDPACPAGTPTVASQAQGSAAGAPDLLTVSLGVTTGAPTAVGALGDDSAKANAVIASLRADGVTDADMQTSLVSVQPTYSSGPRPALTGYSAANEVTVKLHNLGSAGALIDGAAKAAGNAIHIDSISYSIQDDRALALQARADAVRRATAQAKGMASGAGMRLGGLCSVTDVQPQFGYAGGGGASSAGTIGGFSTVPPIEMGTLQITAQLTAVFRVVR